MEGALNSLYGLHDPSQLEIILGLASHESHHVTQEYEQERVDKIKCENTNKNKYENSSKITCENTSKVKCENSSKIKGENSSKVKCENMSKIDCEEVFISEGGLDVHQRKSHPVEDVKKACEVCGQVVSKLKEHKLRKHPENLNTEQVINYPCPDCDYTTRIKSTLKQHIFNIHTERNLSCDLCKYKTAIKSQLNQHKKKVHGVANIFCSFDGCSRKFVQECDLKDHIKRTHPTGFFNCHQCGKQFVNEEKLKRHIKMHNIDTEGLPCNLCALKFITKQKLREHMNTHTGATPYKCPGFGCEKAFMSSSSLSHHKKSCPSM